MASYRGHLMFSSVLGAAYGAALLGGVAGGAWASPEEAVQACVRVRETVEPDPTWIEPYHDALERYRALYPKLRTKN